MNINRRSTVSHLTIVMAMGALLAPVFGVSAAKADTNPAPQPKKSLIVMPVEKNFTDDSSETFLRDLGRSIRGAVSLNSNMDVVEFTEKDPTVQRALSDSAIRREDIKNASENSAVTARIASELGADYALTTSVDEYKYDMDNGTLSASISCQIVDVRSKKATKVISASADIKGDKSQFQGELEAKLKEELSNKAAVELFGAMPEVTVTTVKAKKKSNNNVLWWLLGAGVIAAIAGNSGGGSSSSGNSVVNPPATP